MYDLFMIPSDRYISVILVLFYSMFFILRTIRNFKIFIDNIINYIYFIQKYFFSKLNLIDFLVITALT